MYPTTDEVVRLLAQEMNTPRPARLEDRPSINGWSIVSVLTAINAMPVIQVQHTCGITAVYDLALTLRA